MRGYQLVTTRANLRTACASAGSYECTYVVIVNTDDA
jgi:hypothetical protein